ncbi:hypothetical protein NC653_011273 [Populus alba x Populus x berolinensis]|uniref:Uncharacterized protein n=1 Tax=Populus alba x Populus x berolinensis TaxID=444605 RepID=A0AAD6R237_9ROSI|nr:hypothetical protein NC653_011273 [Populus alba x Populus x berolinensis]
MGNYQNHIKLSSNYREKKRKEKKKQEMEFLNQVKNPSFPQILQSNKKKSNILQSKTYRETYREWENLSLKSQNQAKKGQKEAETEILRFYRETVLIID